MQDIGTQFHIRCNAEDVGRYCFLPGDPGRCESIAKHFDNPIHVGMNREYNIYTGTCWARRSVSAPPASAAPLPPLPWRNSAILV